MIHLKCVLTLLFLATLSSTAFSKDDLRCKGMSNEELAQVLVDKSMTDLNLDRCSLQAFMPHLSEYSKLINLELFAAGLSSLPADIGKLVNLETMGFPKNSLKTLPAGIGNLGKLKELNLEQNKIKTLPAEIGELVNLTTLNLKLNKLERLPGEITKLKNLTSIDLSGNDRLVLDKNISAWLDELKSKGCEVILKE